MPVQLSSLGDVPYQVRDALRQLADQSNRLESAVLAIPPARPPLTLDEIRRALSATGSAPLNIFQLVGASTVGAVRQGTHEQRLTLSLGALAAGTLFWETDRTALYVVGAGSAWLLVGNMALATTLPITDPGDLTPGDAGFLVRATDFDREYRWDGTAWEDAPGQPQRGMIAYFSDDVLPTPATAWQLMDGSVADISEPDGTVTTVTVDDLVGDERFIRSVAGATGGTGGNATVHTHDFEVVDNAPRTVLVGADNTVAAQSGTTSFPSGAGGDDALPPYGDLRPYMRL